MSKSVIDKIKLEIEEYKNNNKTLFVTSSFQTYSLPLLHIISRIDNKIPVYFLNTGFHFPETIEFKNDIARMFGLNVIDIESDISKINQIDQKGNFYYISNSNLCCHLNKVLPMEKVLLNYDVWINGVRKDQNANRSKFKLKMKTKFNKERYHPMLDWNSKMIWDYISKFDLPKHPLEKEGYLTIGCQPCTSKFIGEEFLNLRDTSRWEGMKKEECGLHTDLAK